MSMQPAPTQDRPRRGSRAGAVSSSGEHNRARILAYLADCEAQRRNPTILEIGAELGLAFGTVRRHLLTMEKDGRIERAGQVGQARIWRLASSAPGPAESLRNTFLAQLAAARIAAGLTVEQAAAAAGLTPGWLRLLENGEAFHVTGMQLDQLAAVYGTSLAAWLFDPLLAPAG
jgi:DNA-binding MarR family transcriptional regulator